MSDPAPELDLARASAALEIGRDAISRAAKEMAAAGVPRDRMLSAFATQVTSAVFEVWTCDISCKRDAIVSEADTREIADQIAAMLCSPLSGMLPAGRA